MINLKKPEKLRIVFDCAAEVKGAPLNNSLIQGHDLRHLLIEVLTKFHKGPVTLAADIRLILHQVNVNNKEKNAFKFLWWKESDFIEQPDVRRMTDHPFGSMSLLSCASFALKHTAELFKDQYLVNVVKAFEIIFSLMVFFCEPRHSKKANQLLEQSPKCCLKLDLF